MNIRFDTRWRHTTVLTQLFRTSMALQKLSFMLSQWTFLMTFTSGEKSSFSKRRWRDIKEEEIRAHERKVRGESKGKERWRRKRRKEVGEREWHFSTHPTQSLCLRHKWTGREPSGDELLLPWLGFWQGGFQVWVSWGVRSTCACLAGIWPAGREWHIREKIISDMHFKRQLRRLGSTLKRFGIQLSYITQMIFSFSMLVQNTVVR